ncbi:uncharacterized protein LOC129308198 [Prosopis cineraria]|uniref:uncharacterized protein LOC129308198 n=1 Tax=Prosopis cineraria TaxID=364024 RepID=UPI00240F5C19|nr:uncharacterized protein LOC129308198 [Prosopis cineraria]
MLRRSWSLLSTDGLRRRDASPVDLRSCKQRSQSFSCREMSKELRVLDSFELRHDARLAKNRALRVRMHKMLALKNHSIDIWTARIEKFVDNPVLSHDEKEMIREELSKRIVEEIETDKEKQVISYLRGIQNKEEEYLEKLEIIRTVQFLIVRRQNQEPVTKESPKAQS